ncbi:MAG: STAS domain-containing protein [bacterium]|nr:STAS domain-containing protein [bacterium]
MSESFEIEVKQHQALWIFTTHGYINNQGGDVIKEKYDESYNGGARKFLLNLADSKIINSIGVSILIEILEKTIEAAGELAFCNCAPIVEKTFTIMGITRYAKIYRTEEDAVKAMS